MAEPTTTPQFKVRVVKDYTVFCAGHFITYEGDKCESLHGHNYRAAASVEGDLNQDFYVLDFSVLKKLLRGLCDQLDHKMLVPLHNPRLTVEAGPDEVLIRYGTKRYVFPRSDTLLLPIPNTTAEQLAEWIGGELERALRERGAAGLRALEVEVEESFGQAAACRRTL